MNDILEKNEIIKNILVIMGSPRKGNTYKACEELKVQMVQSIPVQFEYIWLNHISLEPCRGCLICFSHGEEKCPIHDDALMIREKLRKADGVVFATPVYGMSVSGPMKIFIDRFSYTFHRPEYFGKYACLLITTGFMGHKNVLKYLDLVARIWGFEISGRVGLVTPVPLPAFRKEKNRTTIGTGAEEFAGALKSGKLKKPSIRDVVIFHGQRAAFKQLEKISPADYQYWRDKGWLDRNTRFFTDVPVNQVYTVIGMIVGWLSANQTKKELSAGLEEQSEATSDSQ